MGLSKRASAQTQVRVFEAGDLGRRSEEVLAAARQGEVTLTSPAGPELVILSRLRLNALKGIARAAVNLAVLDTALVAVALGAEIDGSRVKDWPWLKEFSTEEVREFAENLRAAVAQAEERGDLAPIEEVLEGWRLSAEILSDPLGREIIYGPRGDDDFLEVSRPE